MAWNKDDLAAPEAVEPAGKTAAQAAEVRTAAGGRGGAPVAATRAGGKGAAPSARKRGAAGASAPDAKPAGGAAAKPAAAPAATPAAPVAAQGAGGPRKRMKVLVVAQQKGGVGKTMLARHLADYAVEAGLRVLAVDLDIQRNFAETLLERRAALGLGDAEPGALSASVLLSPQSGSARAMTADAAGLLSFVASDDEIVEFQGRELDDVVRQAKAGFAALAPQWDLCVIDTAPTLNNLLVAALAVADYTVSPCRPEKNAMKGLVNFLASVSMVRDQMRLNARLATLGIVPNQVTMRRRKQEALAAMQEVFGEHVLPAVLRDRAAIDDADLWPVWRTSRGQMATTAAAEEMRAVCALLFERMGLPSPAGDSSRLHTTKP